MCKPIDVSVEGMGGCIMLLQSWGFVKMPFIPVSCNFDTQKDIRSQV